MQFPANVYTLCYENQPVTMRHFAVSSKCLYVILRNSAGDYTSLRGFQQTLTHYYADYNKFLCVSMRISANNHASLCGLQSVNVQAYTALTNGCDRACGFQLTNLHHIADCDFQLYYTMRSLC